MHASMPPFPAVLDVDHAGLCEAAAPWLDRLPVTDQRVQAAPDSRTVRYYQTTGLLDRPVRYEGRTARYGHRHLLQLVAIRALQSNGLSLAQVQALLVGVTNPELQQIVASAVGDSAAEIATPPQSDDAPQSDVAPQWDDAPQSDEALSSSVALSFRTSPAPNVLVAVELAPGVVVTIDSRIHPDSAHTISVLRRALSGASEAFADAPQGDLS